MKKEVDLFSSNLQEIQIFYQNKVKYSDMPKVTCSADAVSYLRDIWSSNIERVEEFMLLCINRANKVLGWSRISSGGLSGTVADPKVIFQVGLKSNASSIILAHNHPSGNVNPSDADLKLTEKIKNAGNMLDIAVLDHLIITAECYYSFADEGTM